VRTIEQKPPAVTECARTHLDTRFHALIHSLNSTGISAVVKLGNQVQVCRDINNSNNNNNNNDNNNDSHNNVQNKTIAQRQADTNTR